jgi:hypothetical protein
VFLIRRHKRIKGAASQRWVLTFMGWLSIVTLFKVSFAFHRDERACQ